VTSMPLAMIHVALHRQRRRQAAAACHLQSVAQQLTARLQRMQRTTRCPTYSSSGEQLAGNFSTFYDTFEEHTLKGYLWQGCRSFCRLQQQQQWMGFAATVWGCPLHGGDNFTRGACRRCKLIDNRIPPAASNALQVGAQGELCAAGPTGRGQRHCQSWGGRPLLPCSQRIQVHSFRPC
jgi:hypothetical protein